jgi:hypothetical protein
MASKGWSKRFDESIVLEDGTTLRTLQQAIQYLAKTVPKSEQKHEKVLNAADHLTRSAEQNYPMYSPAPRHCWRSTETRSVCSTPIAKTTTGVSAS